MYALLLISFYSFSNEMAGLMNRSADQQVITPLSCTYNKEKALIDLKNLTPLNFCNRWNENLLHYLGCVAKLSEVTDENRRIKNNIKKLMSAIENTYIAHLKSTKNHLDNIHLQLLPYIVVFSMVPPAAAWYYGYFDLPFLIYFGGTTSLIGYFCNKTINTLQDEFDLLNYQFNEIKKYSRNLH